MHEERMVVPAQEAGACLLLLEVSKLKDRIYLELASMITCCPPEQATIMRSGRVGFAILINNHITKGGCLDCIPNTGHVENMVVC